MSKILELKAKEIEAKAQEAQKFYADTDAQFEKGEPLTAEQTEQIKTINKQLEELEEGYKELEARELGREANEARLKGLKAPVRAGTDYKTGQDDVHAQKILTIGDAVLNDEVFKRWREQIAGKGVSTGDFGRSPSVDVGGLLKTLFTGASATSAGALIENDRKPILDIHYPRPLLLRDLVTVGQTESDTVTFARQLAVSMNAAEVAEATATGDGSGAKPESGFTLEEVSEAVKNIAHWTPATRAALADAGQLRTLIETFLRYGLDERLDLQMLQGNGSGANLTGVYNQAGTQSQSFDTDRLKTLRKARTKLRVVGKCVPTAWVMHPNDWEAIDLLKDNEARYIYGGPAVLGNPRVWGLPVVESESAIEGTPIGADWRFAVLWDREQTQIYVSDSHADTFIRNIITILAELRAAFGLIRPAAFIEVAMS